MTLVNAQLDVTKYRTAIHPLRDYSYKNLSNSLLLWYDNQRNEIHNCTLYKKSRV